MPGYRSVSTLVGRALPARRLWRLGAALARVLAMVHARGVVHCAEDLAAAIENALLDPTQRHISDDTAILVLHVPGHQPLGDSGAVGSDGPE